jgi:hypothetical protein
MSTSSDEPARSDDRTGPDDHAREGMAPCPGDPAARLRALTHNWDRALEAMLRDDLERAADLLAANQELLRQPAPVGAVDPALADLHTEAMAAHGRLIGALRSLHRGVREDLMRVRLGRRARSRNAGSELAAGSHCETRV